MTDALDALDNIEDAFPLTGVQAGMLFESLARPKDGVYTGLVSAALPADLDVTRFRDAWTRVVERHQCLRSLILWEGLDQPVQVVQNTARPVWREEDWSTLSPTEGDKRLEALLQVLCVDPVDLAAPSPLRLCLISMTGGAYRFALTCHHAFLDNWSVEALLREVAHFYQRGDGAPLPKPVPYRDFVDWLAGRDPGAADRHWRAALEGFEEHTRLAFAAPSVSVIGGVQEASLQLDPSASDALRETARGLRVTLGTLLATIWGIVVHRISDADDVMFGLAVTQRPPEISGIEQAVGNFVATLPVRCALDQERTLGALIGALQSSRALDAGHAPQSLSHLASLIGAEAGTALFDTVLTIEQPQSREDLSLFENIRVRDRSEFPLSMFATTGEAINLRVQFDREAVAEADAKTALTAFATALRATPLHLDKPAHDLPVMDGPSLEAARKGDHGPALPSHPLVFEQIEAHMAQASQAPAIITGDATLSYGALRQRVGGFQTSLLAAGVSAGGIVALYLEDPADTIAAMLAVWRVGCAYAPISVEEPPTGVAAKLAALDGAVVIGSPETRSKLPAGTHVVTLAPEASVEGTPPIITPCEDNPAYVIFTSGSTGTPKGVVVTHANLAASTAARMSWYGEWPERFLLLSPLIFDSSVAGLYWALSSGGALVIPDANTRRDPKALTALIAHQKPTHTLCLPSVLDVLLETGHAAELASLKTIIVAGEPVLHSLVKKHHKNLAETVLVNEYGPTEATVWCAAARLTDDDDTAPIGRAIPGTTLTLRDRHCRPVQAGLPAELFVGGAGVARGYLGLEEETQARFIPDPDRSGKRLYRTGDLVRLRSDGQLDYIGRADDQLKIRGHRVEPAGIEAVIMEEPGVAAAAVVLHATNSRSELVAYVVFADGATGDPEGLRASLRNSLPDYMCPSRILVIPALPQTQNGKVDRRELASRALPERVNETTDPPTSATEIRLSEIWCETLGLETRDFGVADPFFSVGGDSLAAMRLVGRIAEAFEIELSIAKLLGSDLTIRSMAKLVDARCTKARVEPPTTEPVVFPVPVTEGLKNLWLASRFHPGVPFFNLDIAVRLSFVPTPQVLQAAIRALAERHGALQLNYRLDDGTLSLVPSDAAPKIHIDRSQNATTPGIDTWLSDLVSRPFDVTEGALWRCGLLERGPDDAILALVIHHTISDGWSLDTMMRDLVSHLRGDQPAEPPKAWDIHAFARHVATQDLRKDQADLSFWSEALAGVSDPARIPTDHPMPRTAHPAGHEARRRLSSNLDEAISRNVSKHGTTLLPLVWAALAALTWQRSGSEDVLMAVSHANRDSSRLMDVVGCFTQPLPYRLHTSGNVTFEELFQSARRFSDAARSNATVPVEEIIRHLPKSRQTYLSSFAQTALQINDFGNIDTENSVEPLRHPATITSLFELSVEWRRNAAGLECGILGRADLFEPESMARLLDDYLTVIRKAIEAPEQTLRELFGDRP